MKTDSILIRISILMFMYFTLSACENNEDADIYDGPCMDSDGNVYDTVMIGDQVWMAENLRATHYRNGDSIQDRSHLTWNYAGDVGAYSYASEEYKETFGLLYNFRVIHDARNVCPKGWRVPSASDWAELSEYLGGDSIAGGKLKSVYLWYSPNTGATNETGFSALPAGFRAPYDEAYHQIGIQATFWSNSVSGVNGFESVSVRHIFYDEEVFEEGNYTESMGAPIRCIKN